MYIDVPYGQLASRTGSRIVRDERRETRKQTMKIIVTSLMMGVLIALSGCNPTTSGGPGTTAPDSEKPMVGQTDDTFRLVLPQMATDLDQGESKTIEVSIDRATNFDQRVSLAFNDLPAGVSVTPSVTAIESMEEKVNITIAAAADASLGDFKIVIVGSPESGGEATTEMKLTISKPVVVVEENIQIDTSEAERTAYIQEMQVELDAMQARYEELRLRAAAEQGDTKAELDRRLAEAQVKLQSAEASLEDARNPANDRWDKMKDGFNAAMVDLKTMFE